ncbi:MAG: lactate utilization protein [Spirochaetales bacterium]|nr:lactate utilization protein [Candidatus Physcosoma equi]
MDANYRRIMHIKVKNTVANLEKHNFKATFVNTKEEALTLIKTLVPEGSYTAMGGSMTLEDTGIASYIRESTDLHKDYRDAYRASFYLASANAITENGEVYQVDGRSNRVSAILFGPEKVILVAGWNKLTASLEEAVERVKNIAAPVNATRLCRDTPCVKLGHCIENCFSREEMGGCFSPESVCNNAVIMRRQVDKDRITVIIVGEDLGY